jgi:hypothetical protein
MQSVLAPASRGGHHNVVAILRRPGFRRLLTARLLSQVADGWFQAGLASSVFFSPERAPGPAAITSAFAVLLLPYSVLGPFVGVFLDRWSRRNSLAVANLARAVCVVPAALSVWAGRQDAVFLLSALAVIALNRFFLSGVAAAQPHVVESERLVTANSFATTAGSVCYSASLGIAGAAIQMMGTALHHYALICAVAAGGYLVAALLIFGRFPVGGLGPDDAARANGSVLADLRQTAGGLVAGLRHLARRPAASTVLAAQAVHRLLYGILILSILLLYRNYYTSGDAGSSIKGLLPVAAAGAIGSLLAAVITPPLVRKWGTTRSLLIVTGALALLVPPLAIPLRPSLTVAGALVVSLGALAVKIITDTTLQLAVDDDYRGRVFSVNDTGYNLLFVLGLTIGALALPTDGASTAVMLAVGAGYIVLSIAFGAASRRFPPVAD